MVRTPVGKSRSPARTPTPTTPPPPAAPASIALEDVVRAVHQHLERQTRLLRALRDAHDREVEALCRCPTVTRSGARSRMSPSTISTGSFASAQARFFSRPVTKLSRIMISSVVGGPARRSCSSRSRPPRRSPGPYPDRSQLLLRRAQALAVAHHDFPFVRIHTFSQRARTGRSCGARLTRARSVPAHPGKPRRDPPSAGADRRRGAI